MYDEAVRGVYYLRIREKRLNIKSRNRSRSRPRIERLTDCLLAHIFAHLKLKCNVTIKKNCKSIPLTV